MNMDKETQQAWDGWVAFTCFGGGVAIFVAALLGLMALAFL